MLGAEADFRKYMFLKIWQYSGEKICVGVSFYKKRFQQR